MFRVGSLLLIVATLVAAGCSSKGEGAGGSGRLTVLSNVAPVEEAFNADKGHARLVLILSPTWSTCRAGASWVQENILSRYPDADLRVYVGWIPVLMPDTNPEVADLLVDKRARHYWDAKTRLGRYVADLLGQGDSPAWDMYLVYGPDAEWGDQPDASGAPVIAQSASLKTALEPYLRSA